MTEENRTRSQRRNDRRKRVKGEIFERDNHTCLDCGWKPPRGQYSDGSRSLTIDHIVEKAVGGRSTKDNFQTLCNYCNTKRSIPVSRAVREGQDLGLTLEEARRYAAKKLGYGA